MSCLLGCLAWLAVAAGLAVVLGRAIRLADRRRPLGSEQWHPNGATRRPGFPLLGITRV